MVLNICVTVLDLIGLCCRVCCILPVQVCMQDEADAERQLKAVWSSAAANHREICSAETQVEGSPSYVEVLTCLEMYQGTASTAPPRRRRQP